ncbi:MULTISPECIES: sugar phosphate isomerase/epimerase family protein [Tessaracoccus]|uniref:sugar phosphate isomerase/epimerase family protein n=1 Tax=Tessaracoccus TaxID=72763 RepID=UPI00099CF14E|nr:MULTISPECIES: sugar phosphate isomerase/epimerase family protein [Tessaracoccus]AQX16481.1 sugar phosphate isomerase [Tessaracoccus sp. T2.5-30]VEP41137.1 D-tagatose 3-epimerase [Tessaracoccus lapidicaptus]
MQNYEKKRAELAQEFQQARERNPERFERRLNLSWSNWGFGIEPLEVSVERLARSGLEYIELHGNHYGPDLGYQVDETRALLDSHGMKVSGVCGMFSEDNDLASNRPHQQQAALDYIRREAAFTRDMGGSYLLVVPGAVGRAVEYDAYEFDRSVAALRLVADVFTETGIKAAIEPIRRDEVTLVTTVTGAIEYIEAVDHPGVQHINGDVFHMQAGEPSIAEAVLQAGDRLVNLHMADSNRLALGSGTMDIDAIIMALYLIGANTEGRYVTPEPLGPGASPYVARNGRVDAEILDRMVADSVSYFRSREESLLA